VRDPSLTVVAAAWDLVLVVVAAALPLRSAAVRPSVAAWGQGVVVSWDQAVAAAAGEDPIADLVVVVELAEWPWAVVEQWVVWAVEVVQLAAGL